MVRTQRTRPIITTGFTVALYSNSGDSIVATEGA